MYVLLVTVDYLIDSLLQKDNLKVIRQRSAHMRPNEQYVPSIFQGASTPGKMPTLNRQFSGRGAFFVYNSLLHPPGSCIIVFYLML